ncbi:MAG: hypothetical protein BGO67_10870 [Alphaproteobacteria bacterium 41-28]|nr:MAG: hypothetical protein BGO67_10870 [Alphaproteobacteria bacterium 41-28]
MNFKTMSLFVPMMSLVYSDGAFAMLDENEQKKLPASIKCLADQTEESKATSRSLETNFPDIRDRLAKIRILVRKESLDN